MLAQHGHHPCRHIGVEGVVGREGRYPGVGKLLLELEKGHALGDIQRLGLARTGHHAAVVVAEHDDGLVRQVGTEHTLARAEKVIAVHQPYHCTSPPLRRRLALMVYSTTPHTIKSVSGVISMGR